MFIKIGIVPLAVVVAIAMAGERGIAAVHPQPDVQEIRYVSADRNYAMVFLPGRARIGSILVLYTDFWPSSPVSQTSPSDGVQCITVGTLGNSVEYALRRPIRADDRYRCGNTRFHVARCFDECRSAVVAIVRPVPGRGNRTRNASMIVDSCAGVVVISEVADLSRGIPHNAALLRGASGILADSSDPACPSG